MGIGMAILPLDGIYPQIERRKNKNESQSTYIITCPIEMIKIPKLYVIKLMAETLLTSQAA